MKMKRRDFLKAAIAAPVVGLGLKPKKTESEVYFREIHNRWGWVQITNSATNEQRMYILVK